MLTIKRLEAGYGKLQILFGIDMEIQPDEITVLIGPNGAGKSTVLKSIFNLTDIYRGAITFRNTNITRTPTHELIELGIGFVPQGRQVFNSLTVKENLQMGAFLTKEQGLVERKMKEVLRQFPELKSKLEEYAFELSGGQQQMLAIARALMQTPKVLLMDEPSLGLSPKMVQTIFQKIIDINREGTAILMVEQNAKQACRIADKVYVLEDGRIALHGDKSILKDKRIQHVYLGGR